MSKAGRKLAVGTLIGAAVGFVAGVLTAPKSGKETRRDIKDAANKAVTEGEHQLKKLYSELNEVLTKGEAHARKLQGRAKDEFSGKLETARKAKAKARDILTALHEGGAEDAELKAALKEVKAASDHLKKFLKT